MERIGLLRLSLLVIALACCDAPEPSVSRTVQLVRPGGGSSEYFAFNAHRSASGEVTGSIVSRSRPDYPSPYVIEGRVTCVRVVGNRASIGGELVRFSFEDWSDPGQYHGWVFYAEDNRDIPGTPDRISEHIFISKERTTTCPIPAADSATEDVSDGDVVVSTNK